MTAVKLLPASTKQLDLSFKGKTSYYTGESITGSLLAVALIIGTSFTYLKNLGKFQNAQCQEMPYKNNYELSKKFQAGTTFIHFQKTPYYEIDFAPRTLCEDWNKLSLAE